MATKNYPSSLVYEDGTEVRLCPLEKTKGKPFYCSRDARFFSYRFSQSRGYYLREIKPSRYAVNTKYCSGGRKNYLCIRQAGSTCHMLMALTWVERLDTQTAMRLEVDHINGVATDNRVENLQWVTRKENEKRAVILRARRMVARQDNDPSKDPKNMKPEELLELFSKYNVAGDVYEGE